MSGARWPLGTLVLVLAGCSAASFLWFVLDVRAPDGPASPAPPELGATERSLGAVVHSEPRAAALPAPGAPPSRDVSGSTATDGERLAVTLRGEVLHVAGHPMANTGIGLVDPVSGSVLVDARTGSDGRFRLELAGEELQSGGELRGFQTGLVTLRGSWVAKETVGADHVVLLGEAGSIVGSVTDDRGSPVSTARVRVTIPDAVVGDWPVPEALASRPEWVVHTERDGSYELVDAPLCVSTLALVVTRDGFERYEGRMSLDRFGDVQGADVTLRAASSASAFLAGIVLHAGGEPAAGALVRFGPSDFVTGADGHFRLPVVDSELWHALSASLSGYTAAVRANFGEEVEPYLKGGEQPPFTTLTLGPSPARIAGRVVDAAGRPLSGWHVAPGDDPVLDIDGPLPRTARQLSGGEAAFTRTGLDGRFVLRGLEPREYTVMAWHPESLLMIRTESVSSGTEDLVLQLPDDARMERLAGWVLDAQERPVAGARVTVVLETFASDFGAWCERGATATTNVQGKFELRDLPRHWVHLAIEGEAILPAFHYFDDDGAGAHLPTELVDLELRVERRLRFRFEDPSGPNGIDALQVRNLQGDLVETSVFDAHGWQALHKVYLIDGHSPLLSVSEAAHTLDLFRLDQFVGTIPLNLNREEVTVVQP